MKKGITIGTAVLAASMLFTAYGTSGNNAKAQNNGANPAAQTEAHFKNWATFGYDYALTRHVPFNTINKDNVKNLGLVWSKNFKDLNPNIPKGQLENFPIVIDGIAYVSTQGGLVFALDAITGQKIWEWIPPQSVLNKVINSDNPIANRGVAVADGKVFIITNDNGLAAIDQKTGKTIKFVHISDYYPEVTTENGYYETTAPVYYNGKLFIGSSGGDNGVRGFEMAFNTNDLTPAWDQPFWTIPPKGEGWRAGNPLSGGGTVWMPPSIDKETGIMYISVGNPSPDFYGAVRPGSNPHTDSVVALDTKTGKMIWAQGQQSHDQWDYDTADSPTIVMAKVNGVERKVVTVGTKGGEWFAYDAKTGEPIYENVAFDTINHPAPTPDGVLAYPGVLGGQNYAPDTFDPKTNLDLIPSIESPMVIKSAADAGNLNSYGTAFAWTDPSIHTYGRITAIDLNNGKIKWEINTNNPMRGGLTSTKTGLTFYGELDGHIKAIETATGKELWSYQTTGDNIMAAPTIFEKDGKTYVMITSSGDNPKVFVFGLNGEKTQAK